MTRYRSDTVKGAQEIISGVLEAINPPVDVELGEVLGLTGISSSKPRQAELGMIRTC